MATLPPLDFGDSEQTKLPPLNFGDDEQTTALPPLDFNAPEPAPEQSIAPTPQKAADGQETGFLSGLRDTVRGNLAKSADFWGNMFTPSGQAELLANPETAGPAGAILGPLAVASGGLAGDSPIAETEYENRHKANLGGYEYTPQGAIDPLAAEKLIGGGARVLATGGFGPLAVAATEAAARAGDISAHEPGKLGTLGGLARVGVAGATAGIPMKAGMAIERAVASQGLSGAKAFIANALADVGIGATAGTVQKATELLASGVSPTSEEFWQGLKPTSEDAVMGLGGAIAAGAGGAATSGARRRLMEGDVLTPAREAELQTDLEAYTDALRMEGQARADARMARDNARERQRIADVEARAAQTRDMAAQERAETNRVQEQQSIVEARRNIEAARRQAQQAVADADAAFRENPTYENAQARVAAVDRVNELAQTPTDFEAPAQQQPERLALPMPKGMTTGEFPGIMKGGDLNELPTREGQGQTPGRPFGLSPLRRQSQAIEATQPTAGEGVVNLRGQEIPMPGQPVRRLGVNALERKQGPSSPIEQQDTFNPELGEFKTSTLSPEAERATIDMSYTDADTLQQARRGSIPVEDTLSSGQKLAETKGAKIIKKWKPGQAFNAEQLVAVKAYTGGLSEKMAETQARYSETLNPTDRSIHYDLADKQFDAVAAMLGGKTEAGRALNILRKTVAPAKYSTGEAVSAKGAQAKKLTPDDKTNAIEYLTKLYGDRPVPESVKRDIADISPDDAIKMVNLLRHQTRINNKTPVSTRISNYIKAGMLSGVKTLERNVFGLEAKYAKELVGEQIASFTDWALSAASKNPRTKIGLSPLRYGQDFKRATKEGVIEGWQMLKGDYTSDMARAEMDRFEFKRDQYSGEGALAKIGDLYVNTVFRATGAVDLPVRKRFFYNSITDQAKLTAINEYKAGAIPKSEVSARMDELRANPSDAMVAEAMVYAEQMVYADENVFASGIKDMGRGIQRRLRKKGMNKTAGATEIAETETVPFLKVPFNITWDVLKTSVLDAIKVADQAPGVAGLVMRGRLTPTQQKAFSEAVGNSGIGAGLMLAGAMLYLNDRMTGSYKPDRSNMRQTKEVANRDAASIRLGGMWFRAQEVASPVTNLIALGATMARAWTEGGSFGDVGMAAANTVIDNPFFKSVKEVAEIPERGVESMISGRASSLVPAFVADIASLTDDTQREVRKQEGDTIFDTVGRRVAGRIPGLRNTLQPKVNAFGQVQPESKLNVINAAYAKEATEETNPVVRELIKHKVGLQKPQRYYDDKTGEYLETEEQYLARVKRQGELIEQKIKDYVTSQSYRNLNPETQKARLEGIVRSTKMNDPNVKKRLGIRAQLSR